MDNRSVRYHRNAARTDRTLAFPLLATPDPAVTTLFHDIRTAPPEEWLDVDRLVFHLTAALDDESTSIKFPFDKWVERMRGIVFA